MSSIQGTLPAIERQPQGQPAGRQATKDLLQALKTGDLDGAKTAYVEVIENAPEGASWNRDSAFAQVGRALLAGNVEAAREAAKAGLQALRPSPAPVTPGVPEPVAAPSTTGGTSGTLLNVVA